MIFWAFIFAADMAAGLMVGPEKNERVMVRSEPKTEEAMVAVLMGSLG